MFVIRATSVAGVVTVLHAETNLASAVVATVASMAVTTVSSAVVTTIASTAVI